MTDNKWEGCLQWLIRCKALPESKKITDPIELAQYLRDGVILCKLLNNLCPGCLNIKDVNLKPQLAQFICLKNIRLFLHTCQTIFGLTSNDLFDSNMLYDFSDFEKVIVTLSKISKCLKSLQYTNGFDYDISSKLLNKQQSEDIYKDFEFLADKHEVRESNGKDQSEKTTEDLYEQLCTLKRPAHQIFLAAPKDKREHCIRELVETEINYIKALKDVVTNFMIRMKLDLGVHDTRLIYGNIEDLIEIHEKFEKRLCEAAALSLVVKETPPPPPLPSPHDNATNEATKPVNGFHVTLLPVDLVNRLTLNSPSSSNSNMNGDLRRFSHPLQPQQQPQSNKKLLGNVFLEFSDKFLVYGEYCSQLAHAQIHLDKLLETNERVRLTLWDCQMKASQGKFHLRDLLALPVQRILKYHILLKELLKYTPDIHEEKDSLRLALEAILDLTFYINEVKRDAEGMELTNDIQRNIAKITMPPNRNLNQYGRLIKDGELKIKSLVDTRIKNRYVFLFETMMLMCKSTKSDIYNFKNAIALESYNICIPTLPEPGLTSFLHSLALSYKHVYQPHSLMSSIALDWKQRLASIMVNPKKEVKWSYCWLLVSNDGHTVFNLYAKTFDAWFKWMEALATAKDNLKPSTLYQTNHAFEFNSFSRPTRCTYCRKLLRGAIYQGYRCTGNNCGYVVHKECIPLVGFSCDLLSANLPDRRYAQPPLIPKRIFDEVPDRFAGTLNNNDKLINDNHAKAGAKEKTSSLPYNPSGADIVPGLKRNIIGANRRQEGKSPSATDILCNTGRDGSNAFLQRRFRNSLGGAGDKIEGGGLHKIPNHLGRPSLLPKDSRPNGDFVTRSSKNFSSKESEIVKELDDRIKCWKNNEGQFPRHSIGPLPFHSNLVAAPNANKNYCNLDLQDRPWFIGEMTRQEAKACLQDSPTGTFLVRYSSHQGGNPVITLKFKNEIKHIKVLYDDVKGYYISECEHFPNIVELISHYQTSSLAQLFIGINTTLAFSYKMQPNAKIEDVAASHANDKDGSKRSSPSTSSSSPSRPNSPQEPILNHQLPTSNRGEDTLCTSNHVMYKSGSGSLLKIGNPPEPLPNDPCLVNGHCGYISKAVARFDFDACSDKMISFKQGDKILVVSKHGSEKGWWKGQLLNRAQVGYFPLNYVVEDA